MAVELRRVLIATDFSERSVHAARWGALHIAGDAEVVLAHVVAIPDIPRFVRARFPQIATVAESAVAGATRRLNEVAATLHNPCVRTEVRVGGTAEQIADMAREVRADLIIVGRHGDRPGLTHRIGTTADRVIRIAPVPVLLATSMRDARPRHILVALDDADITPRVVEWSRYLATRFGAGITGLHVVTATVFTRAALHACTDDPATAPSPLAIQKRLTKEGVAWLRGVLEPASSITSVATEVCFGWAAHEIVAAAERTNSELIVVGRAGSGLGRRMLMGTMTRQVLRNALCPVLVVAEPEAASNTSALAR